MPSIKITEKHKAMAYVLNNEFGYTMSSIADLMKVSQSTISSAIKDFKYNLTIRNLENQINEVRKELKELGYFPKDILPVNK